MEFMALPGFTPAHHKPVPLGDRLAVAEAEAAAPGPEGQQPCHRMDLAGRIDQLLAEQQQATARGDRFILKNRLNLKNRLIGREGDCGKSVDVVNMRDRSTSFT
jgi:hypothetical protein